MAAYSASAPLAWSDGRVRTKRQCPTCGHASPVQDGAACSPWALWFHATTRWLRAPPAAVTRSQPAGGMVARSMARETAPRTDAENGEHDAQEELAALRRERDEALEQQAASADILRLLARDLAALESVLDGSTEIAVRLFRCRNGSIQLVEDGHLRMVALRGTLPAGAPPPGERVPLEPGDIRGRAVLAGRAVQLPDTFAFAAFEGEFPVTAAGLRRMAQMSHGGDWRLSLLAVPLLRGGEAIGVLVVRRPFHDGGPFTDQQIALVQTFADQAVIALENARLFQELNESNRVLTEQKQQTVTAEVLRLIASAPADLPAVLTTIAERACRLCEADDAEGVAAGVWADLTAWAGEERHHGDLTLLVLRVPLRAS